MTNSINVSPPSGTRIIDTRIIARRDFAYLISSLNKEIDGSISSTEISEETKLFTFNFAPEKILEIEWSGQRIPHLLLLYPVVGKIELDFPDTEIQYIDPYQIIASFAGSDNPLKLRFQKGTQYEFYLIKVNRPLKKNGYRPLYTQLEEFFENTGSKNGNLAVCGPNLALNDIFSNITSISGSNLPDNLLTDGYGKLLLGNMILHFRNWEEMSENSVGSLTQYEIEQIRRLTSIIKENPGKGYKVDDLCRQGGLSVTKLQEGFRSMHGETVAKFIQKVRLEKAEELIRTSDMNISEIVYTIGLSSRSYFSKIFKQRYECKPSMYKQQVRENKSNKE